MREFIWCTHLNPLRIYTFSDYNLCMGVCVCIRTWGYIMYKCTKIRKYKTGNVYMNIHACKWISEYVNVCKCAYGWQRIWPGMSDPSHFILCWILLVVAIYSHHQLFIYCFVISVFFLCRFSFSRDSVIHSFSCLFILVCVYFAYMHLLIITFTNLTTF